MAIARNNATLSLTELVKENPVLWESMTRTGRYKKRPIGQAISEFLAIILDIIFGGIDDLNQKETARN